MLSELVSLGRSSFQLLIDASETELSIKNSSDATLHVLISSPSLVGILESELPTKNSSDRMIDVLISSRSLVGF